MAPGRQLVRVAASLAVAAPSELVSSKPLRLLPSLWSSTQKRLLVGILTLAVGCRLWGLAAVCLDGDEIFSLLVGRGNWREITAAVAADSIHPPLFYYLLHVWLRIGNESLAWLRLLPASVSILSLLPLILFCRQIRLRPREINSVVAVAAIHPYLIYYSQHLRMYSLLLLLGLASLWLFSKALSGVASSPSAFIGLTLVNAGMVYCHYYGWLVVAMECGYVIIRKRAHVRCVVLSLLAVVVAFAPWAWIANRAIEAKGGLVANLGWIPRPGLVAFLWFFVDLAGCAEFRAFGTVLTVALLGLIIGGLWSQRRLSHRKVIDGNVPFLVVFTFVPIVASFVASWVLPESVWGHRHLVFIAAPFLALCSIAGWRARGRIIRVCMALVCALWAGQALLHVVTGDDKKLPWDKLVVGVLALEPPANAPLRFYSVDPYLRYPVWFYLEGLKAQTRPGVAVGLRDSEKAMLARQASFFDVRETATPNDLVGEHFWVAYSPTSWRQQALETLLINRGCAAGTGVTERDRFHEVRAFPVWCVAAANSPR